MNAKTRDTNTREEHTIWIEKYRPRTLTDIVGQDDIVARLGAYVTAKNLPHLLFTGSAGIGKTTAAVALAKDLYGDHWEENFREMNASDERGIDAVRNGIKQFAKTTPMGSSEFKLLFLDEADALTNDAQAALRRTMESYAQTCRFILSCNYSAKIIDPIQSRCAIYRFKPLTGDSIKKEMVSIAEREGLTITPAALDALVYTARGDMRKAINAIQGSSIISQTIDDTHIYAITSMAKPEEMVQLLALCYTGEFEKAEALLANLLHMRGLSTNELLYQLYHTILNQNGMDRGLKVRLIDHIGETDFRLSEGANSEIQMEGMLARFVIASEEWRKNNVY
jgi:replication factor C small subunit